MPSPVALAESRTLPLSVEHAYDALLPVSLPDVFRRRYGTFPPIAEVRDQLGEWGSVGQSRTIALSDGATMRETLTHLERPSHFEYRLSDLAGRMSALVASIDGRWVFEPVEGGTRVTWQWDVHPASRWAVPAMPLFQLFWHGYARNAFDELESVLIG